MLKTLMSTVAVVALLGATPSMAQTQPTPADTPAGQSAAETQIGDEVQAQIREFVTTQAPTAWNPPADMEIAVGTTLPADVEFYSFEGIPDVQDYQYVVVDNRTVLVDPADRRIVTIIE